MSYQIKTCDVKIDLYKLVQESEILNMSEEQDNKKYYPRVTNDFIVEDLLKGCPGLNVDECQKVKCNPCCVKYSDLKNY